MTLGERIKLQRESLGLTLLQLAQKVGVSEATVQRYESGEIKTPRHDKLIAMAKALGVDVNYLVTGNEEFEAGLIELNEKYIDQYTRAQRGKKGEKQYFEIKYYENNVIAFINGERCDFVKAFFELEDDGRKSVILDMLKRYC